MPLECYFSHSWAPEDVPLNVFVWEAVAGACTLYVDREGAKTGDYFINRLEELIRKSDVFVSVLAYRNVERQNGTWPDYGLSCSPGSLFEIRLAERARKPRWIIYDDRTGFIPPVGSSDKVVYTAVSADEELLRHGETIRAAGEHWLRSVNEGLNHPVTTRSRRATLLVDDQAPDAADVQKAVEQGLRKAGYMEIDRIEPVHTDAEVVSILQSGSLLVAEVDAPSTRDLYAMAHALFIPSIRFQRDEQKNVEMPRLLDGHPGGYQHDLVLAASRSTLADEVARRATAMRDARAPIVTKEAGCAYLRRSLYRPHRLLFSHNLAVADADLLQLVFARLDELGVRAWEYRHNNQAGVVWKDELQVALQDATDVAFIFGNEYELSAVCADELRTILDRRGRDEIKSITPFLWGGRSRPNPDIADVHHEPLPADKQRAAEVIVDRVVQALSVPVRAA
jgi:hypothetical protein